MGAPETKSLWFAGEYEHALDSKGRVSLPASLRKIAEAINEGQTPEFFGFHQDDCVFLVPGAIMVDRIEPFRRLPFSSTRGRDAVRLFFSRIHPIGLDGQGRVLLPEKLRGDAQIDGQVVCLGALDHIELWDKKIYTNYLSRHKGQFEAIQNRVFDGLDPVGGNGREEASEGDSSR